MAHTKAQGSKARQGGVVKGKRRGIKIYGGSLVKSGSIIVRQLGTKFHAGRNVKQARDCTLFSTIEGRVYFRKGTGDRRNTKFIDVLPLIDSQPISIDETNQIGKVISEKMVVSK